MRATFAALHEGMHLALADPAALVTWHGWMHVTAYLAVVLAVLSAAARKF